MSKPQRKPILNASLPAQFRQIRIALAREPDHPEGAVRYPDAADDSALNPQNKPVPNTKTFD